MRSCPPGDQEAGGAATRPAEGSALAGATLSGTTRKRVEIPPELDEFELDRKVRGVGGVSGRHPPASDGSDAGDVVLPTIPSRRNPDPKADP